MVLRFTPRLLALPLAACFSSVAVGAAARHVHARRLVDPKGGEAAR